MPIYSIPFHILLALILLLPSTSPTPQLLTQLHKLQNQRMQLELRNKINIITNYHYWINLSMKNDGNNTSDDIEMRHGYKNVGFSDLQINKDMHKHCSIPITPTSTSHLFQTPRNPYILTSSPIPNPTFSLHSSDCKPLATLPGHVKQIFCDRGLCDDGNVVLLLEGELVMVCSEMRNFTDCAVVAKFGDGKERGRGVVVGGAVRNKGNGMIEIYVAFSEGQIIVLDGQGKHKLSVSLEPDSKITHFLDMHPYPVILSSKGWLYTLENTKYLISLTKCPYLHHKITHIFLTHPYSSHIYAIDSSTSAMVMSKLEMKMQPKGCQLIGRFFMGRQIDGMEEIGEGRIGMTEYKGTVYIGNKIVNVEQETVEEFGECGKDAAFNFQLMKNNYRKGFFTIKCTPSPTQTPHLVIFKQKSPQQTPQKNNTIIMLIIILVIVFLLYLFFRSTAPNLDYDQELKYNQNMKYKMEIEKLMEQKEKIRKMTAKQGSGGPQGAQVQAEEQKEGDE